MIRRVLFSLWLTLPVAAASGESSTREQLQFFESRVRPLLVEHCYSCHSAESDKLKGGLRLDSRDSILQGGDSGPAAVPGDPEHSLLVRAIRYTDKDLQMPPRRGKLPDAKIADLEAWIRSGMPWPAEASLPGTARKAEFEVTASDRAFWAFQPIHTPALPSVRNGSWVRNPIDAFVLAKLEAQGLSPNPPASPRELVRRVYFDLLGLPPNPEEVRAFLEDHRPDAYERLVDRLLARREYGERWARHWLDVVRFAQSNGYERDGEKPFAWRYRDYLVDALNQDKPYDRFIVEQIAGDEIPDANAESVVATGFQRLGVWDDEPDDPKTAEYDALDDVISTTSAAFLGLTLGCARCHNHKFDPISQSDYYGFLAFFRNVRPNEAPRFDFDSANYLPLAAPSDARAARLKWEFRLQSLESSLACAVEGPGKRALEEQLKALRESKPAFEWALAVRETGPDPTPTHLLIRGNAHAPGPEVQPHFLSVLGGESPVLPIPERGAVSTGRRTVLARWIASPANPLTARVAVNRVWHYHFGLGIVSTTADFGHSGALPTHPELLDWLSSEFIAGGWSLKRLHRLVLLSSTYRMSSRADNPTALAIDPSDALLWRQRLRRLEAEAVWDSALAISGELNSKAGGRGFFPDLDGEVLAGASRPGLDWDKSSRSEQARRSLYMFIRRTTLVPLLETFDYNNSSSALTERPTTTVAPQALMLLNSRWAQDRAGAFARRVSLEAGSNPEQRVRRAFALALGRPPTARELATSLEFVQSRTPDYRRTETRLTFRPDVPPSLFEGYMNQLSAAEFLRGPGAGWNYYRGRWSGAYEGIRSVDRDRAPFALKSAPEIADGAIELAVLLHPAIESGSLLLRSSAEKDEQRGYELLLDPRKQRISLRRQDADRIRILAEVSQKLPVGRAFPVRVDLAGARIRAWMLPSPASTNHAQAELQAGADAGGALPPVLDVLDSGTTITSGHFGIRSSGAALSIEQLRIRPAATSSAADCCPEETANGDAGSGDERNERLAWESFCLLLLNLNEFIYVD